MTFETRTIELADRGTYQYADTGGDGRTLLLLHGYLDSWYSFAGLVVALPPDIRVMALTQRGHGASPKPPTGYTIGEFADDALAFADAMGLARFALGGHSMGSLVAQEVALRRPAAISHLVLLGSACSADLPHLRAAHDELRQLEDPVPEAIGRDFQGDTCANPLGPGVSMDRIVEETMHVPARVWDQALAGTLDYRLSGEKVDLSAIGCPTLVVWGSADGIFPRATQDDLVAALPDARIEVLDGVGHGLHWERPESCARLIVSHLEEKTH